MEEYINFRFEKCKRCYWYDSCPLDKMTEKEISQMQETTNQIEFDTFSNYGNCEIYYSEYCEYFMPFDDGELRIIEYEKNLKEREIDYDKVLEDF